MCKMDLWTLVISGASNVRLLVRPFLLIFALLLCFLIRTSEHRSRCYLYATPARVTDQQLELLSHVLTNKSPFTPRRQPLTTANLWQAGIHVHIKRSFRSTFKRVSVPMVAIYTPRPSRILICTLRRRQDPAAFTLPRKAVQGSSRTSGAYSNRAVLKKRALHHDFPSSSSLSRLCFSLRFES